MLKLLAKLQSIFERRQWSREVLRIYPTKDDYNRAIARRICDTVTKIESAEVIARTQGVRDGYHAGVCDGYHRGCLDTTAIAKEFLEKRLGQTVETSELMQAH